MATAATILNSAGSSIPLAALAPAAASPQAVGSPSPAANTTSSSTASSGALPLPQSPTVPSSQAIAGQPSSSASSPGHAIPKQKRWHLGQISAGTWIGVGAAFGALIVAVYYGAPVLRLARWTAWNDFRESCVSDRGLGIWSAQCNRTLAEPSRPPPVRRGLLDITRVSEWLRLSGIAGTIMSLITATVLAFVVFRPYWLDRSKPVLSHVRYEVDVPVRLDKSKTRKRKASDGQCEWQGSTFPDQLNEDELVETREDDSSSGAGLREPPYTHLAAYNSSDEESLYQQVVPFDAATEQPTSLEQRSLWGSANASSETLERSSSELTDSAFASASQGFLTIPAESRRVSLETAIVLLDPEVDSPERTSSLDLTESINLVDFRAKRRHESKTADDTTKSTGMTPTVSNGRKKERSRAGELIDTGLRRLGLRRRRKKQMTSSPT